MNRTLTEATVKTYYSQTHQPLKEHLHAFLMAYNSAKRLKPPKGLSPMSTLVNAGKKNQSALSSIHASTPLD